MRTKFFIFSSLLAKKMPFMRSLMLAVYNNCIVKYQWQARNIFTGFKPIKVLTGGQHVFMIAEGNIAKVIWEYDFEKLERSIIYKFFKNGSKVINIGANAGLYALMAGKAIGPKGEVHAFEPASISYTRLIKNIELNKLDNIVPRQIAISDVNGVLDVCRDPVHPSLDGHFNTKLSGRGGNDFIERITCTTLDEYWGQQCNGNSQAVDLMIIDVEGAEVQILRGAKKVFLDSPNLIMMIECTENIEEIGELLSIEGFNFYIWDEYLGGLKKTPIQRGNLFISRDKLDAF